MVARAKPTEIIWRTCYVCGVQYPFESMVPAPVVAIWMCRWCHLKLENEVPTKAKNDATINPSKTD